jgi:hypothetical protein
MRLILQQRQQIRLDLLQVVVQRVPGNRYLAKLDIEVIPAITQLIPQVIPRNWG